MKSFLIFAAGLLFACGVHGSSAFLKRTDVLSDLAARWKISGTKEHVVPNLRFRRSACVVRIQKCCYRYLTCGRHCKKNLCTQVPECTLRRNRRCVRFRTLKVCKARCYHKMCPRYECAPLETKANSFYKIPKPFKNVRANEDTH